MRDTWFLDQDVNAWTSLAYVVVGGLVIALAIRRRLRPVFVVLGLLAIAEGVGSMMFHGGSGDPGRSCTTSHSSPRSASSPVGTSGGSRGRADTGALAGTVVAIVAGSVVWAAAPSSTNVMVGVLVAATVVAEVLARRRGLRGRLERAAARARRRRPRRVVGRLAGEPACATPGPGSSHTACGTPSPRCSCSDGSTRRPTPPTRNERRGCSAGPRTA